MMKMTTVLALVVSTVFLFPSLLFAQAPVTSREAVPVNTSGSTQLIVELQSLREEISSLRGTIEELEYKIQRLEKKQTENYADLDGRVAGLYSGQTAITPISTGDSPIKPLPSGPTEQTLASETIDAGLKSSRLYDQGFSALRQGNREEAIQSFRDLVNQYPDAREAPDARYWLGETYWLANKKEESRQSFVQLLELTPDYRKAGDAMYRLGVIYDQLGDFDTAFDYMSQVLLNGSSQSVAAQAWINEHQPAQTPETAPEPSATPIDE